MSRDYTESSVPSEGKNTIAFDSLYWLEVLDPQHRPINFLYAPWLKWQKHYLVKPPEDFFDSLNKQMLNYPSIQYCTSEEAKQFRLFCRDGKLYTLEGKVFDTTSFTGKQNGFAMFVIDKTGNYLYAAPYQKYKFHHSSLSCGDSVLSAGMIKVQKGKIVELNNCSGHYKPDLKSLKLAASVIPKDVYAERARIVYKKSIFESLSNRWKQSAWLLLRTLGRALEQIRSAEVFDLSCRDPQVQQLSNQSVNFQGQSPPSTRNDDSNDSLKAKKITTNQPSVKATAQIRFWPTPTGFCARQVDENVGQVAGADKLVSFL